MIPFDPQNPFPLLAQYTYAQAKEHARLVDSWLGFECEKIEKEIYALKPQFSQRAQETWIGLDAQSFQTPYVELRSMLEDMQVTAGDFVIDLGCAYGRLAHVMKAHYPMALYRGYELVQQRVSEGQRVLDCQQRIQYRDLLNEKPEPASHYLLYDYGSNASISKTLEDLREISKERKIKVVGRGRASRFLIHRDHAWLSEVNEPLHRETYSIYTS